MFERGGLPGRRNVSLSVAAVVAEGRRVSPSIDGVGWPGTLHDRKFVHFCRAAFAAKDRALPFGFKLIFPSIGAFWRWLTSQFHLT